ncbi:MAG: phenylacetate-CoA oxygenase subunit PaaJ [Kordiimonadaceae bacterium]|nr:phenylacetate-CoA oxygenase subunit PaaJ [Kordiimonadaceae bacterium]
MPSTAEEAAIWAVLADVPDPEVPALSLLDLGVIRAVHVVSPPKEGRGGVAKIDVTPTYTGCPATALINEMIKAAVTKAGYHDACINMVISPAWTTDWITAEGREKLREYGIAPPVGSAPSGKAALFGVSPVVTCPRCSSKTTEQVSEFGATACKAMYRCLACQEPFEYFKCI